MSLTALFKNKTVFSLEVVPPKKDSPKEAILPTLQQLQSINPDFISVTLGLVDLTTIPVPFRLLI